jgi:magnesium transporter
MEKLNRIDVDETPEAGTVVFRGFKDSEWHIMTETAPKEDVNWIDVRGNISDNAWKGIAGQLGLTQETLLERIETGQHSHYFFDKECEGMIIRVLFQADYEGYVKSDAEAPAVGPSLRIGQLSLIQTKDAILTISENADDFVDKALERYHEKEAEINYEFLVYLLLDTVIDEYYHVMMDLEDRFETLEDVILARRMTNRLGELHSFRKTLFSVRTSVSNLHDALENRMMDRAESHSYYSRELYNHLKHIEDYALYFREGITSLIEIMLTMNDNRLNEIMTTLTVFSTIFIPLTFLTGVYGMNFEFMPELEMPIAYPLFWVASVVMTIVMINYFKRRKWM